MVESKCSGFLDKSKIHGPCGFPLANPHSVESLHYVSKSNPANLLILLYICLVNLKSSRQTSPKRAENLLSPVRDIPTFNFSPGYFSLPEIMEGIELFLANIYTPK